MISVNDTCPRRLDISPSRLDVKICGIDRPEILRLCIQEGADYAGLVFFPPSPRHLSLKQASDIASVKSPQDSILLTGLFVNPDPADIEKVLAVIPLDFIQLHGHESLEQIQHLKSCFGLPIIKAIAVSNPKDLLAALVYDDLADLLLFDAKPDPDSTRPGGLGKQFNWSLMTSWTGRKKWLLAGGLADTNLHAAQKNSGALGFDVSSYVESELGVKSADKVQRFIRAARALEVKV